MYREQEEFKQGIRRAKSGHEMSMASKIKQIPMLSTDIKKWVSGSRVGPLKNNGNLSLVSENEGGEWVNEDSQSGFAGGRSCLVNSIEFFEE